MQLSRAELWMSPRERAINHALRRSVSPDRRATPIYKFTEQANSRFPVVSLSHRHYAGKAILFYERCHLTEDRSEFGSLIIVRLIYVLRGERGKGVCGEVIRELKRIADATGCCLYAVSAPFDRLHGHDDETLIECARDFDNTQESVWNSYGEGWHLKPQKKMDNRFRDTGFQRVELNEYLGNAEKYGGHCWIYLPQNCDADLKERISPRLIKKE